MRSRPFSTRPIRSPSASRPRPPPQAGVPLLRLERPGWQRVAGDRWHWVDDIQHGAARIAELGAARVILTTGRQGLAAFATNPATWFLTRCVDQPVGIVLPARHEILLDRGPYTLPGELALLDGAGIDLVATEHSGGPMTAAKLAAARAGGLAS